VTLALTLLVVGLALLFFEILLPGLILGTCALLTLAASVFVAYTETEEILYGHLFLGVTVVSLTSAIIWFIKYFPSTKMGRQLVSTSTVGDLGIDFTDLINQTGTAYTDLRPSGKATIGDQRLNVVTEGSYIEKDNSVKVIVVEGNRVVVRKT
jgi:membrane-bound serine protease (ClpP class)